MGQKFCHGFLSPFLFLRKALEIQFCDWVHVVDVRAADFGVVPLLDWCDSRMRIFLGNNNF